MTKKPDNSAIEKSKPHIIVEILEYVPKSVLTKTIIKKTTGNITVSAVDQGEELAENEYLNQQAEVFDM